MFLHKQSGGQGHAEIAAIEGKLHQSAVGHAHAENLGKSLHHRVGDVVGKAPQAKQQVTKTKANRYFFSTTLFIFKYLLSSFYQELENFRFFL